MSECANECWVALVAVRDIMTSLHPLHSAFHCQPYRRARRSRCYCCCCGCYWHLLLLRVMLLLCVMLLCLVMVLAPAGCSSALPLRLLLMLILVLMLVLGCMFLPLRMRRYLLVHLGRRLLWLYLLCEG